MRIRHPASGTVAESLTHASQLANRKVAFLELARSKEFTAWHRLETSRRLGNALDLAAEVDRAMRPHNLKIEGREGSPVDPAR